LLSELVPSLSSLLSSVPSRKATSFSALESASACPHRLNSGGSIRRGIGVAIGVNASSRKGLRQQCGRHQRKCQWWFGHSHSALASALESATAASVESPPYHLHHRCHWRYPYGVDIVVSGAIDHPRPHTVATLLWRSAHRIPGALVDHQYRCASMPTLWILRGFVVVAAIIFMTI